MTRTRYEMIRKNAIVELKGCDGTIASFHVKPGMVLCINETNEIKRIVNNYTNDSFVYDLMTWKVKGGKVVKAPIYSYLAPIAVKDYLEQLEDMKESGRIFGYFNPNRNPERKRRIDEMLDAARLYREEVRLEIHGMLNNIPSNKLTFDGITVFEEYSDEEYEGYKFIKRNGFVYVGSRNDGNYTEYVGYRTFCNGKIIVKSEFNDCEFTSTNYRFMKRKEYDEELKYMNSFSI